MGEIEGDVHVSGAAEGRDRLGRPFSHSVMSDSSRPQGLQPTRLLHPWDFPGKSTGVGCHCLLPSTPQSLFYQKKLLTATPRIESAWVQGFCTHTVNTGRLTPLWRDCGILTWSSRISLGAISRELGLWPTPSPALVLSEGAGTLLWALRGKSSPRGVGRGRWGLRRAQALATETKDRSDKSCVGKPNRVLCGAKE